jgi:glycosyl transferase family 25
MNVFVVIQQGRPARHARMELSVPSSWNAEFTTHWPRPLDRQLIDPEALPEFGYFPWKIASENPCWNRPLRRNEIGCAVSHWLCWNKAHAERAETVVILEDDAVLVDGCERRLANGLVELEALDPSWDLAYLGCRSPAATSEPIANGILRAGFSHCTYGYALSARGLTRILSAGFEQALIPVHEFLAALCIDHPRDDVRCRYPKRLNAYAFERPLVTLTVEKEAREDMDADRYVAL